MTSLTLFILFLCVVSALLYAAAWTYERFDDRVQQWPGLWAVSLALVAIIPALGLLARALPNPLALPYAETLARHLPLDAVALPDGEAVAGATAGGVSFLQGALIVLAAVYLLGVVTNAVKLSVGRHRVRKLVRLARSLGHQDGVEILLSRRIHSPFAWSRPFARTGGKSRRGFIVLPQIYLDKMSPAQIQTILHHEREHLSRRDDEMGLILRSLLCVCWISPFAHALFKRWSQATEIRCDMAVTQSQTPRMRKAYAQTLMQALHIMAGRVRPYPAASFSTHRLRTEKMRIAHILDGTPPSFKRGRDRIGLMTIAISLTLAGTLGIAATATANPSKANPFKAKSAKPVTSDMVDGRLTARFGLVPDPFKAGETRLHKGIDIAAPLGTPIYAPADGTIKTATTLYQNNPKYGTVVVIQTDEGITTLFSHLDGFSVTEGQRVTQGQQIATVGTSGQSTGPHVHIETYRSQDRVDPMDVWTIQGG